METSGNRKLHAMGAHSGVENEVEGIQFVHITLYQGYVVANGSADDALVLLAQVNKLDKANDRDLDILRKWLVLAGGNGFPYGIEAKAYDDSATSDLVAVSTRCPKGDSFTRWLADTAVPRFHQVVGYRWKVRNPTETVTQLLTMDSTTFRDLFLASSRTVKLFLWSTIRNRKSIDLQRLLR